MVNAVLCVMAIILMITENVIARYNVQERVEVFSCFIISIGNLHYIIVVHRIRSFDIYNNEKNVS